MNHICPKCQHIGEMLFIKVFENNLVVVIMKCSGCWSKIKYTVKAEVVK